jgi:hypothetical protein
MSLTKSRTLPTRLLTPTLFAFALQLGGACAWQLNDLTAATGAPLAGIVGLDGYTTPDQQHVNFIGPDGHVNELFFAGGSGTAAI